MQLKHVAALLLPLSSGVIARPIQENSLLNILSNIGGTENGNAAGIIKRQANGISFDAVSMLNKYLPLQNLPVISGLRKRDAEAGGLDSTFNTLSNVGGTTGRNGQTGGGFLGILKRGGLQGRADQGTSKGQFGKRQLPGVPNPMSLFTSFLGGFGGLGGQKDTTTSGASQLGQQLQAFEAQQLQQAQQFQQAHQQQQQAQQLQDLQQQQAQQFQQGQPPIEGQGVQPLSQQSTDSEGTQSGVQPGSRPPMAF